MDAKGSASHRKKRKAVTKRNRYEDAIHAIDEALKIDPRDAMAWIGRDTALIDLGREEEAR
jgi:Flp pilus assembly protein TadD